MRSRKTTLGAALFVLAACWTCVPAVHGQLSDEGAKVNYPALKSPETRYSRNGILETRLTADFSEIWLEVPDSSQVRTLIQKLTNDLESGKFGS